MASRWTLFSGIVGFTMAMWLTPALASAEGGSVRFSYEKVEIADDVEWVLVPAPVKELHGKVNAAALEKAFEALRRDKRATYGKSSISVSGRVPDRANVVVKIDPKVARYALIIMAETVYTMTEFGVPGVKFPGHASGTVTRKDVPFSAYTLTVPLWRAVPDMNSKHVLVRMPDGQLLASEEVHRRWRARDEALRNDVYGYLKSPDAYTVMAVARLLPKLKIPYAEQVVALLGHDNKTVRKTALDVLEGVRDDKAVLEAVARMMTSEKDDELAVAAAEFLGKSKSAEYAVQKTFFLLDRGNEKQQVEAASALGSSKDPRAVERLVAKLESKNAQVARAAAGALTKLGATPARVEALKNAKVDAAVKLTIARDLASGRDKDGRLVGHDYLARNAVREEAVRAIESIGKLGGDAARQTLEKYTASDKSHVRVAAAQELAQLANPASLDAIASAVKRGEDADALEDAGYRIMLAQPLKVVLEHSKDRNKLVQRMAYRALGERAQKEGAGARVFKILVDGLSDRDPLIRGAAARAIGTFGDSKAAKALEKVTSDKSASVRRDVAVAIGDLKDGALADTLKKYLQDSDPDVVAASILSMAKRGEAFAWDQIKELRKSEHPQVRAASLEALTTLVSRDDKQGVREVISMLSGAVSDSAGPVRQAAVIQLGRFKEDKAVTAIALQVNAEEEPMRVAAVRALGRTGHPSATELVVGALGDSSARVRRAAIEALGQLKDRSAKAALQERIKQEKDPELVELIQKTLKSI